jgi:hypothetical protein
MDVRARGARLRAGGDDVTTAVDLRHDAVARLAEISAQPLVDVRLVLARPRTIDLLYRQALRSAAGDELLLAEVRQLLDVAKGRATPLIDAVHEGGVGEPTQTRMTADEVQQAFELAWGVSHG